jgi:hypothetical protein
MKVNPSRCFTYFQPPSCLARWWCRHSGVRLHGVVGPPSTTATRWSMSQSIAGIRQPRNTQVGCWACTSRFIEEVGRRLVVPTWTI